MATASYEKGATIYKASEKMKTMGLIVKGSVMVKDQNTNIVLEKGNLLGCIGCDKGFHACDYVAIEDTTLVLYNFSSPLDLDTLFAEGDYGSVFTLATLRQVKAVFSNFLKQRKLAKDFHQLVLTTYRDYKFLCSKFSVPEHSLSRMDYLSAPDMDQNIPDWEENYYWKLISMELDELKTLLGSKELCYGTIAQAGNFLERLLHCTDEYINYLEKHKSILFVEKKNDLFHLMFDLENRVAYLRKERGEVSEKVEKLLQFMETSELFERESIENLIAEYHGHDFAVCEDDVEEETLWNEDDPQENAQEDDRTCLQQILMYADFSLEEISAFENKLKEYMELPDRNSTEDDARALRKWLGKEFYRCYKACVKNSFLKNNMGPIISMFINFGFMDVTYLGGEENANAIYDLAETLYCCNLDGVHTFYEWLKSIYEGKTEPSINELDMDFNRYLKEEVRTGGITADEEKEYRNDPWKKVEYELDNMFLSAGKVTSGRITTFCPILSDTDLMMSPEKMLVTSAKIRNAIETIKSVDYGLFYREVMYSDEEHGLSKEFINKEILPDIILMPNVGSRAMMWQPTADARNNTKARFVFPILCTEEVYDLVLENCGRYRWEICRKIQGGRWNDITTPSLTSEFNDYLQYYRKNHELSAEAKEKIYTALKRARNNFREVFVKDYECWIKYESKGSFRLNKQSREILFAYCPFSREIRNNLKDNPMYQDSMKRYAVLVERKLKRLNVLYSKYTAAGGTINDELKENMEYYNL